LEPGFNDLDGFKNGVVVVAVASSLGVPLCGFRIGRIFTDLVWDEFGGDGGGQYCPRSLCSLLFSWDPFERFLLLRQLRRTGFCIRLISFRGTCSGETDAGIDVDINAAS